MNLATTLATLVALASPAISAPTVSAPFQELPYKQLAERFLDSKGKRDAAPEATTIPALLAEDFLKAEVGLFDIWIPADELKRKSAAKDFGLLCSALCAAQTEWITWLGAGAHDGEALLENIAVYQEWIEDWETKRITGAHDGGQRNVLELLDPDDEVRAAGERFARDLRRNLVLGSDAEAQPRPVKLVLMPSRKGFVELIAYAGALYPEARHNFWLPGIQNWSQFDLDDMKVIAMEYASPAAAPGTYTESYDMRTKSTTGMEEQIVQLGLNDLLAHQHGEALPPSLVSGLSINLVTKLYEACHTRIDGDTRGKVTAKREVFVRGGQAEGGILPPNTAESRWRQNYGRKHYAPMLKQAQKAGAGEAKRLRIKGGKYNSFLLERDTGAQDYLTQAPLLGPSAGAVEVVPNAVYGDYLEFTRAYRSAFLHWLQHHGESSRKKAAKSFAQFLSELSGDAGGRSIAQIAEEIYGDPLSDPKASKKSLEGRFLKWITKQ